VEGAVREQMEQLPRGRRLSAGDRRKKMSRCS
jgi:hypothetical protein